MWTRCPWKSSPSGRMKQMSFGLRWLHFPSSYACSKYAKGQERVHHYCCICGLSSLAVSELTMTFQTTISGPRGNNLFRHWGIARTGEGGKNTSKSRGRAEMESVKNESTRKTIKGFELAQAVNLKGRTDGTELGPANETRRRKRHREKK